MAGILATRLSDITSKYKIHKTVISSGMLNSVDGYYNFYNPMNKENNKKDGENLDFGDDDWTGRALCYRPKKRFNDVKWEKIKFIEKKHFTEELSENYLKGHPLCNTKAYFEQSPYHHAEKIQGSMMILVGKDEEGTMHPNGALQFQEKVGSDRVEVSIHNYGHGGFFDPINSGGDDYWYTKIRNFFDID